MGEKYFEESVREVLEIIIKPGSPMREARIKLALDTIIVAHNNSLIVGKL